MLSISAGLAFTTSCQAASSERENQGLIFQPRAGGWPLQLRDLRHQDQALGLGGGHSTALFVVLLAGPGRSEHQAGEDAELFLLGCIPLLLWAWLEPSTLTRNL